MKKFLYVSEAIINLKNSKIIREQVLKVGTVKKLWACYFLNILNAPDFPTLSYTSRVHWFEVNFKFGK